MGYFSNGTEGEWYEKKICSRCVHHVNDPEKESCTVWSIHLLYNYGQERNLDLKDVLDGLIPRSNVPGYNDLCTMFHPSKPEYATHGDDYKQWLATKGKK